jgi:hypothetical protein
MQQQQIVYVTGCNSEVKLDATCPYIWHTPMHVHSAANLKM